MQGQRGASSRPPHPATTHPSPRCYLYRGNEEKQAGAPPPPRTNPETGPASHNIPTSQPQQPFRQPRLSGAESNLREQISQQQISTEIFICAIEKKKIWRKKNKTLNNASCVYFGQTAISTGVTVRGSKEAEEEGGGG